MAGTHTVVFLGPSCDRAKAASTLAADYRTPAERGDVAQAVKDGATTIVLIDGLLIYNYPPSPMEIFHAIQAGVRVIGSASLGALRAVELRHHGMQGSGWVHKQYLERQIFADDEVVTSIDSRTSSALTIPLVRIRFAANRLRHLGLISATQEQDVIIKLGTVYYEDRTAVRLLSVADSYGIPEAIATRFLSDEFDIKAIDTLECLSAFANQTANAHHCHR
jgi:TfuA protein